MTIEELYREFRYHALKRPLKTKKRKLSRVEVRRDDDSWTVRLIARTDECEEIKRNIDSMICCRASFGLRPSPRYNRLTCHISADRANDYERALMDDAAAGRWGKR